MSSVQTVVTTPTRWERLLSFDEAILLRVRRWEVPWATRVMLTTTKLGDATTWFAVGFALWAAGGEGTRYGTLLGSAALVATALSQSMKRLWVRARPALEPHGFRALVEHPDRFSFPSGHTTAAFAVAVALAGEGAFLGPLSFGAACGIGMSRIYLGAHYPLDVAAGAIAGSLAGLAVRLLFG